MSVLTQYEAFLAANTTASLAFREVVADLTTGSGADAEIKGYAIFGGAARDINADGAAADPRDIDIVVDTSIGDLRQLTRKYERRSNNFNGLNFTHNGVRFDMWSLRETWGLRRNGKKDGTFADLLGTTFFNLEAIVIETVGKFADDPIPNPAVVVHDGGYQAAITNNLLELNNPINPVEVLQMVRTCSFKKRLGLDLGPNLEDWILAKSKLALNDELLALVQTRYFGAGNEVCTPEEMRTTLDAALTAAAGRAGVPVPAIPEEP